MEKNLTTDPTWIEYYDLDQLQAIEEYMNKVNSNVVVFKCECCNEYSASLADNYDVILPMNWDSKEECIEWCNKNDFPVIGETINNKVIYFN